MAQRKEISLTNYVTRILLLAFSITVLILILAIIMFQLLIQASIISPANTGEKEARLMIEQLSQSDQFSNKVHSTFYDYVYFDREGNVKDSSLSGKALKEVIAAYPSENKTYSTGAYVLFSDGGRCLFSWSYKAQFTNRTLQKIFPSADLVLFAGTLVVLVTFFLIYIRSISKKIKKKLLLIEQASQQITQQNLDSAITTSAEIKEFNQVLKTMEVMRKELKNSLLQQWKSQQQRTQEVAALTHDIKTPLTIINGNAELLLEDTLNYDQKALVQNILYSGSRANQYIAALQQVTTVDFMNNEKEFIALESIIGEINKVLEPLANAKNLLLDYQYSLESKPIYCALFMLTRSLINIGENAIRFTESGTVTIEVIQNNQETAFIFNDNGPGFSNEALLHAKDMLWQQDKSRTHLTNYGIGLAIAEKTAEYHDGRLILENSTTHGKVSLIIQNA